MEVPIMANKKHYIITSITLGLVAAASGALIGLTNLVTKEKIAQNEKMKIGAGMCEIYGKNRVDYEELDVSEDYKYVQTAYKIYDETITSAFGLAFKTSGSNMYGKISLIVGFDVESHGFTGLSVVVNEQTYAAALEENYIDPLNEGSRDLNDVSCGATYGAKLIRDMVNEAKDAAEEYWSW